MHDALCDVLDQDKDEFVRLFMERVNLKQFLDNERLCDLYKKVVILRTCMIYRVVQPNNNDSQLDKVLL